ncbi:Nitronate monooxygenase [Pararobbsia alpina]|uniref:NAD(P)H-dependent flavin oxidoreductase n=1 Tax=Pararobbsia alpina TaxID=621374 RepID=UPI0039A682E1
MSNWPDQRLTKLVGVEHPIVLAPMAGPGGADLAIAVAAAGGLASLPCAQLSVDQARDAVRTIREKTSSPLNLNFFCHTPPTPDPARSLAWRARLAPYYAELGLDAEAPLPSASRRPFDADYCALVEEVRPEVVSFHFGLPEASLLARVKATGARIFASATTVAEAQWLEARGVDVIIAMGFEAGGHRGNFLSDEMATQVGTFALVPQVVDAVKVPVIAAGGIADARGIVAAFALGASGVQIGTAYLFCPEAKVPEIHRQALREAHDDSTAVTNVFTGRPARGIMNRVMREMGPMAPVTPPFPLGGGALAPLRAKTEPSGVADFVNLWSGQASRLAREMPAGELTRKLASEALARFGQ